MADTDGNAKRRRKRREPGFLPIQANAFDRVFIGVILYIAIHLLWMRFLEPVAPLFIATILSVALAVLIVAKG